MFQVPNKFSRQILFQVDWHVLKWQGFWQVKVVCFRQEDVDKFLQLKNYCSNTLVKLLFYCLIYFRIKILHAPNFSQQYRFSPKYGAVSLCRCIELRNVIQISELGNKHATDTQTKMIGDVEKMVAVGLVWGATNAIMRRGALLWDQALKSTSTPPQQSHLHKILASLKNWLTLLSIWQYTVPFFINLSASVTFFAILSHTPISLTVPVTNATTFAATAVFGMLLGEETRVGHALFGTGLIVLGVWLCIMKWVCNKDGIFVIFAVLGFEIINSCGICFVGHLALYYVIKFETFNCKIRF